jgi:hypothetical protein
MRYSCFRCGYKTNTKQDFFNHLSRKNICEPIKSNIALQDVIIHYQKIWSYNSPLICPYCNKVATENDGKFRAHKNRCKKKAEKTLCSVHLVDEKQKLKEENEKLKAEIKFLKENPVSITNNIAGDLNITINALGNEDLSHLSNEEFRRKMDVLARNCIACWDLLTFFVHNVHYGNRANENVRIKDANDLFGEFHNGNEWIVNEKKQILDKIVAEKWGIINEFLSPPTTYHKYFRKVDEKMQFNSKYKDYLRNQLNGIFANNGNFDVLNNVKNETAKMNSIHEFLFEE